MNSNMSNENTRQVLIQYLLHHPARTVSEISKALHLTKADIRYHLKDLIHQGSLISLPPPDLRERRGRPAQRYQVAELALPHNLVALSSALLTSSIHMTEPKTDQTNRLENLAQQMAQPIPVSHTLPQRLAEALDRLRKWNYEPAWEASPQGPRIILHHCPYMALISNHPELCELDRCLITILTGVDLQLEYNRLVNVRQQLCAFSPK